MYQAGIDEAGRGSVLGPIVMAIVVAGPKGRKNLNSIGVKDSKLLRPKKRKTLFLKISGGKSGTSYASWVLQPPSVIDSMNLNKLEMMMCLNLIKSVDCMDEIEFIVDDFTDGGWKKLGLPSHVRFETKADTKYVVVGAASILAKVVRDHLMMKALEQEGGPKCSGYPSDPKTIDYLREYNKQHGKFPPSTRLSWATCKRILKKK